MTEQSIYSMKTVAMPVVMPPAAATHGAFPIFACDLSKLDPATALRAELRLASMWRDSAKAEGHMRGFPKNNTEMVGKLSNIKPNAARDARVLQCLSGRPITAWRLQQRTGFAKSSVHAALATLKAEGKANCIPPVGKRAAHWWRADCELIEVPESNPPVICRGVAYISQAECARALGVSEAVVSRALQRGTLDNCGLGAGMPRSAHRKAAQRDVGVPAGVTP